MKKNESDKFYSKSNENICEIITNDLPVVISRKDAIYQGSLHNIPLYNEDSDEYHREMIKQNLLLEKSLNKLILIC